MSAQPALEGLELREGSDPTVVHVLMPNMAYACGGSILTKVGTFVVGARPWSRVTCPDCVALGESTLLEESLAQQGRQQEIRP